MADATKNPTSEESFASLLGIDSESFAFIATDAAEFAPTGTTLRLRAPTVTIEPVLDENQNPMLDGQGTQLTKAVTELHKVTFRAFTKAPSYADERERNEANRLVWKKTSDGTQVEGYVTLLEPAQLHRLTLIRQTANDGHEYFMLSGVMRAKLAVGITLNNEAMPIEEVLTNIVNSSLPEEEKLEVVRFCETMAGLGVRYNEPMALFWQHFALNPDMEEAVFDALIAQGAEQQMIADPGRIEKVWFIPNTKPGIPVVSFEMGQADRAFAKTQQGFLDLVNAQIENLDRIIGLRRQASALKQKLAKEVEEGKITPDEVKKLKGEIALLTNNSRRYAATWAGGQQIVNVDESQNPLKPTMTLTDQIGPINAPVGRMTVLLPNSETGEPEPVEWDFWSNSGQSVEGLAVASAAGPADQLAAAMNAAEDAGHVKDEEPF